MGTNISTSMVDNEAKLMTYMDILCNFFRGFLLGIEVSLHLSIYFGIWYWEFYYGEERDLHQALLA